jgi:hypothetical protein
MTTSSNPRVRAALHVEKTKIVLLLAAAKAVYNGMSAAVARFPAPTPALAILQTQTTALDAAQQMVARRSGGEATATRNSARNALWASLQSEKAYVQATADANEADAVAIIKSAGFDVAAPQPARSKPVLDAKLTVTSGTVKLVANAMALAGSSKRHATYNWQYSADGGHTWLAAPSTSEAASSIVGLPLVTTCSFRVCVTLKGVMQPWSQVVTLLVH